MRRTTDLEIDASETTVCAFECVDACASGNVPKDHLAFATCARQTATLEPDRIHRTLMSRKRMLEGQGLAVPYANRGVL